MTVFRHRPESEGPGVTAGVEMPSRSGATHLEMALGDDARRRHARQLLLAEVGERGQARLCAHAVALRGDPRAAEIAALYLSRAGVTVKQEADVLDVPGADALRQLAGRDELCEAAAFVAGAFAAVEEIKRALELGAPGRLPAALIPERS